MSTISATSQSIGPPEDQRERNGLTSQDVVDVLRDQAPEPIRAWCIQVGGRRFPLSQVWEYALNQPRSRYTSNKARRRLEALGFRPSHIRRPDANRPTHQDTGGVVALREPEPMQPSTPQSQVTSMSQTDLLEWLSMVTAERDWLRERVERAESERELLLTLLTNTQQSPVDALQAAPQLVASPGASEPSEPSEPTPEPLQVIGSLTINRAHCTVTVGGDLLQLTPTEYQLLCALADPPDHVHLSMDLSRRVWGEPSRANASLPVHMRRVRQKLNTGALGSPRLVNIRGIGYLLNTLIHEE